MWVRAVALHSRHVHTVHSIQAPIVPPLRLSFRRVLTLVRAQPPVDRRIARLATSGGRGSMGTCTVSCLVHFLGLARAEVRRGSDGNDLLGASVIILVTI